MRHGYFNVEPTVWFKTITKKINLMKKVEVALLDRLTSENKRLISEKSSLLILLALITFISLILLIIVPYFIAKSLTDGIKEITEKLLIISETDNLTVLVNIESDEELGAIAK
ncbi:MAG TPA: hypothetical protein EYH12_01365 [Psychromonas hadalis]|nr:hypothetical protein [Psychromonas hadalis]